MQSRAAREHEPAEPLLRGDELGVPARPGGRPAARARRGGARSRHDLDERGGAGPCPAIDGVETAAQLAELEERRRADLTERVRRFVQPSGDERALDAGTGTGALAFALAPYVAEVVAVDQRARAARGGAAAGGAVPERHLRRGRRTRSTSAGGTFDLAGCARTLHHVQRPELAIAELARVTRLGGQRARDRPDRARRPAGRRRARPLRARSRPDRTRGCSRTSTSARSWRRTGSSSSGRSSTRSAATSTATSTSPAATARPASAPRRWPRTTTRGSSAGIWPPSRAVDPADAGTGALASSVSKLGRRGPRGADQPSRRPRGLVRRQRPAGPDRHRRCRPRPVRARARDRRGFLQARREVRRRPVLRPVRQACADRVRGRRHARVRAVVVLVPDARDRRGAGGAHLARRADDDRAPRRPRPGASRARPASVHQGDPEGDRRPDDQLDRRSLPDRAVGAPRLPRPVSGRRFRQALGAGRPRLPARRARPGRDLERARRCAHRRRRSPERAADSTRSTSRGPAPT